MWRASLYSKREEGSLGRDHKDAKKGGQNSFLHSVTKGSMAVGEYYDLCYIIISEGGGFYGEGWYCSSTCCGILCSCPWGIASGFTLGVRSLSVSEAIDAVSGDAISEGISHLRGHGVSYLRQNFELSDQEANSLVGAGLVLGSTAIGAQSKTKERMIMQKISMVEEILGFTPLAPNERTEIPGTVALEGEEFIYFADDGSGDFPRLFDSLTKHKGKRYAKTGSRGEERCKIFTPDNVLFYAVRYKGDLEGWRKDIELGAKEHGITLAWVDGENFVLSDGKSYKISECKAEFY